MCGVAGVFGHSFHAQAPDGGVKAMAARLAHRGPDDQGAWSDPAAGISLGHSRLSILDLSQAGHQPMASRDGRYHISFNGEIYNFRGLKAELEPLGHVFAGGSDTEVLLAAISRWGVREALARTVGMFAIALWDGAERRLHLARDRFGEKPLYYAKAGDGFAFASELKALRGAPGFRATVSPDGLGLLARFGYIPAPHCIYADAWKVNPGEVLTFGMEGRTAVLRGRETYWVWGAARAAAAADPFRGTFTEAVAALDAKLRAAVGGQMIADVPLGSFLSGGVDSSTITALMTRLAGREVRTFSIGFDWEGFDEAGHARAVAAHLGTRHTELYVTAEDARAAVPLLPTLYDEPFADSSQIPTYLLCRMARREVTVALTGDGADEMFFGYRRYLEGMRRWDRMRSVPAPARVLAGALAGALGGAAGGFGARVRDAGALYGSPSAAGFYLNLISQERDPAALIEGAGRAAGRWDEDLPVPPGGFAGMMGYYDALQYLPDDILVKVDRASMGVSLETRAPFLDHRVCEFAWSLPFAYRYSPERGGKRVVKALLDGYVPRTLTDRPKTGFGVPMSAWLRGGLRAWAEGLMRKESLAELGFRDPGAILARWRAYQRGEAMRTNPWSLLMCLAWREAQAA